MSLTVKLSVKPKNGICKKNSKTKENVGILTLKEKTKMTTEVKNEKKIKVGDKVIYTKDYESPPQYATVCRVTKTQFRVTIDSDKSEQGPYRYKDWIDEFHTVSISRWHKSVVYLWKIGVFNKLADRAVKMQEDAKLRKQQRDKEKEERMQQQADALKEIQAVFDLHGGLTALTRDAYALPDGSRIWIVDVPINAQRFPHKTYSHAIIRCRKAEHTIYEDCDVEMSYTYITNRDSSFSSVSSSYHRTDEDAIWDALRHIYFTF